MLKLNNKLVITNRRKKSEEKDRILITAHLSSRRDNREGKTYRLFFFFSYIDNSKLIENLGKQVAQYQKITTELTSGGPPKGK